MTSKFAALKEMRERRAQAQPQPDRGDLDRASRLDVPAPGAVRRVGRPPGKRSNPDYQQVTVLLHSATYTEARKRLLDEKKEVSELINELLEQWLRV